MNPSRLALLVLIPFTLSILGTPPARVGAAVQASSSHGPFRVKSYMGKCLTYGEFVVDPDPGDDPPPVLLSTAETSLTAAPVYIDDCESRGGPVPGIERRLQQIVVEEINDRHDVMLRAGGKYIGVAGGFLINQAPLELQDYTGGPGQIFALDGDSIIVVIDSVDPDGVFVTRDRSLVVEVKNGRTVNKTPLVLGQRDLNDREFWDFNSVDSSYRAPTNGFVRVPEEMDLFAALEQAHWGSVIQIRPDFLVEMTGTEELNISSGVTIRGQRRALQAGALFTSEGETDGGSRFFFTKGGFARMTGLQLVGPSRDKDPGMHQRGIVIEKNPDPALPETFGDTILDHNRLSGFPTAAIEVAGQSLADWACPPPPDFVRTEKVQVVRNFIHHNTREGFGYGVVVGNDGLAEIVGNTFMMNRHAIAADGMAQTRYRAWFNLVQSNVPTYGRLENRAQADFDMHGSDGSDHHTGGIGGGEVEIARNTFLGSDRLNYDLRGKPCGLHRFVGNVAQQDHDDALRWYVPEILYPFPPPEVIAACAAELTTEDTRVEHQFYCGGQKMPPADLPLWLEVAGNRFDASNPTDRLGVGDFDGDGRDDLFLATGQAWYFSSAGLTEWRQINEQTDQFQSLRFGDFDRDGRTDVLTKHGSAIVVSWAGQSDWEEINASSHSVNDYAIGDFDGDRRSDIFYANGSEWFVSYGAAGPFVPYATSSYRVGTLRFGDFDADKKTDVFGVVSGQWSIVPGGTNTWIPIRPSLENNVSRLVVRDFDGDGRADVAGSQRAGIAQIWIWRISRGGVSGWTNTHLGRVPVYEAPAIGRFDETPGTDVLVWGDSAKRRALFIVSSAAGDDVRWSWGEMK